MLSLPFYAFFSKRAYREVGKNWKGINFAYLFLLMAVCCLPPTLTLRHHVVNYIENNQKHLVGQIPDINITNGRVELEQRQPYYITRKDGSNAIIIDTTGSMNYIDDPHVVALLMESSLIVRQGANSFKTIDLSSINEFHLDRFIANDWLQIAKESLAPVSYGISLAVSYVFTIAVMLLAATLGMVISNAIQGSISFSGALRVATIAATPSIIVITMSTTMGMGCPGEIHAAVTLIYLIVGIKVSSKPIPLDEQEHIELKAYLREEITEIQHAA